MHNKITITKIHFSINCSMILFWKLLRTLPRLWIVSWTKCWLVNVDVARGSRLLDLCKATNMHIANGRLYHDFGVGGYTYYCRNCSSTIDYLILKESDFSCIRNFRICDFNSFSDHAPLCFELNANQSYVTIDEHNSEHVGTRYKWNNEKLDTFRSGIIAKLPLFKVLLNNIVTNSSDV